MNIGIIGNGNMAEALGTRWAAKGHALFIGSRSGEKARALADKLGRGAKAGTIAEAARFGEAVLLAVHNTAVFEALDAAGALAGKVLIDCNNPTDLKSFLLTTPAGTSLAEQVADRAKGARVVKAFNMSQAKVWLLDPPLADGRPLGVPLCGDDAAAKAAVAGLIADTGCRPVDVGPLNRARLLEPAANLVTSQIFEKNNPHVVLTLTEVRAPG